ncbi:MAG: Crp/Fnr family transcriptional regulator [Deltaproteobacteria bacterium]|nr:Crp/Fnr family transcriptional regulator [Deltaproteobacteria bacterium]
MGHHSTCLLCQCQIKENTIFFDLTDEQLDCFKDVVKNSTYRRRETIYLEGEPCTGFYVIRTGRIKLIRSSREGKEQILKILQAGELFGMEVFHEGKQHSNTTIAMDDGDLCFISQGDFFRILAKEPSIARKVIIALSRELNQAYEKIGSMGLMNARKKMAHLLYTLASEYGIAENGAVRLHLTLSRMEIAELLGITQETSIRLLKSFKDEGLIDIRKKDIVINSLDKLMEVSE